MFLHCIVFVFTIIDFGLFDVDLSCGLSACIPVIWFVLAVCCLFLMVDCCSWLFVTVD